MGLPLSTICTVRSISVLSPVTVNAPCGTSRTLILAAPGSKMRCVRSGNTAVAVDDVIGFFTWMRVKHTRCAWWDFDDARA